MSSSSLHSAEILANGYLVIGVYTLLVCLSGWSFAALAFGAFNLLNPIELSREPLRILNRVVRQLDSKRLPRNDVVLISAALRVDQTLKTLAEIIRLTNERRSVDRVELARRIGFLMGQVEVYARNKHRLPHESGWFTLEISYPRWVEYNASAVSIALETSTPLSGVPDWLEQRAAELVASALEACVISDHTDAAHAITQTAGEAAGALARFSRLAEATAFARIIADSCRNPSEQNETANAVASAPPIIMTEILLGWKSAISSWPEEIDRVVENTDWDNPNTRQAQIQCTARVRRAAHVLLFEIHAENAIEKTRITPAWYLRSTLASECIISLSEFVESLLEILPYYADNRELVGVSPEALATTTFQALQMLSKAELLTETILSAVETLEAKQQGHNPTSVPEVERVDSLRSVVIEQLGKAAEQLRPAQSKSSPDYFGQTIFTLLYHMEQAMSNGDIGVIESVFPSVLTASLKLHDHVNMTYRPPTYEFTPANFNPILDLLELSGLALIYEETRSDGSAESVREAWKAQSDSCGSQAGFATQILDILDRAESGFAPLSIMRTNWQTHVAQKIVEKGFAIPEYNPFEESPV